MFHLPNPERCPFVVEGAGGQWTVRASGEAFRRLKEAQDELKQSISAEDTGEICGGARVDRSDLQVADFR